jgi:hypothetical protein
MKNSKANNPLIRGDSGYIYQNEDIGLSKSNLL